MTPQEQRLMAEMLQRIADLEERDKQHDAYDKKLSGQHRAVIGHVLPTITAQMSTERTEDMKAVGTAYSQLVHVVHDIADRQARMEARANLALVAVPDGKGGASIKPASMLAAESAQRTEGKTDAIAIDTGGTATGVRSLQRTTKAILTIAGVPFLVEVVKLVTVIVKAIAAHL